MKCSQSWRQNFPELLPLMERLGVQIPCRLSPSAGVWSSPGGAGVSVSIRVCLCTTVCVCLSVCAPVYVYFCVSLSVHVYLCGYVCYCVWVCMMTCRLGGQG